MTKIFQIYYIPGFPGKNSSTAEKLSEFNSDLTVLEYDPNEDPEMTLARMSECILHSDSHPIIAASSLGGWFAENIAKRIPCDLVLWNPSLTPDLHKYGVSRYYIPIDQITPNTPRTIFLGTMDSIVRMEYANNLYSDITEVQILEVEHRMTEKGLLMMQKSIKDHQCFLSKNT